MTRRLIGDARSTWLYDERMDQWEAQELVQLEQRYNDLLNGKVPTVVFSGSKAEHRYGYCKLKTGVIVLNRKGENLGTLAHELAHLAEGHRGGHGYEFKEAHLSILDSFEEYARGRR